HGVFQRVQSPAICESGHHRGHPELWKNPGDVGGPSVDSVRIEIYFLARTIACNSSHLGLGEECVMNLTKDSGRGFLSVAAFLLAGASVVAAQDSATPAKYSLKPGPKTIVFGYYSAKAEPALRIKSGDTVEIGTEITSDPDELEKAGVPPA